MGQQVGCSHRERGDAVRPELWGQAPHFLWHGGGFAQKRTLRRGAKRIDIEGWEKCPEVGDHIFMVGGAIGADGIHGATFSSLELDDSAPSTAVQIGDPLTQRRVSDFLQEAEGLFSAITDNGAGGLSSSVGEMACLVGGARLDLAKCPVKYPGLAPWELMISESQERMTLAVPPENVADFEQLARRRGVTATDIGFFSDHGRLDVFYGERAAASLDLKFLHEGLPQMNLKAVWNGPCRPKEWMVSKKRNLPAGLDKVLETLLASDNIASKEYWVRQYDQGVQGATRMRPFAEGAEGSSPRDAGVIDAAPHGGAPGNAIAIGCGLAPSLSPTTPI